MNHRIVFVLGGALFLFIIATATLYLHNSELSFEKDAMESELSKKISERDSEIGALDGRLENIEKKYSVLEDAKKELEKSKHELEEQYGSLFADINSILSEFEEREKDIEESMEWFKENSELPDSFGKGNWMKLRSMCSTAGQNSCSVNLACFYLINDQYLNLKYGDDEGDTLSSLEEIISKRRGDCEDFALIYKAEFNDFLERCVNSETKEIEMLAWTENKSFDTITAHEFFLDNGHRWYLPDVKTVELRDYHYANVVCGNIYDLQSQQIGGHCIIAFTKNQIVDLDNLILELNNAPLVEPQTGEFIGYINGNANIYLIDQNISRESYISEVITDDDYYKYNQKKAIWTSYEYFNDKIGETKTKLQSLEKG